MTCRIALRAVWAVLFVAGLVAGCGGGKEAPPDTVLKIDSTPEQGAEVLIGGVSRGVTPLEVRGLPPGPTMLLVMKEGFKPADDTVILTAQTPTSVTVELEPRVGFLTLECEPAGAAVFLNGEEIGKTPLFERPVPIGDYTYELRADNYVTATKELKVEEDFRYSFKHALEPLKATLTVSSRPVGATIWINDERQVEKTPAKYTLTPGEYTLGVQAAGFVIGEQTIVLAPNAEEVVDIKMIPGEVPEGMVLVPVGEFTMGGNEGAPDERPQRKVELPAFYIDKYEVTNAEWKKVFPSFSYPAGHDHFPVSGISFSQAMDFAQKLGKRLPTEAEWEKAPRGTDGREFPWGREYDKEAANSKETGLDKTVAVGKFRRGASPYGCINMGGNVYEWTADWYEAYPGNTLITKDYGQVYRVLRGGSYMVDRYHLRCARRHFDRMDATRADYGLRCVKDVAPGSIDARPR
ncbi:MAG: SUMF1/EgtB/PvdO family nonheme iron enzyme [Candidatus Hydrogenedentes bacterium]|nr:SUMF1/EgtB/PvdO family nonheme iron enzyme [Candidatus Hydrogenedentota bacterium]